MINQQQKSADFLIENLLTIGHQSIVSSLASVTRFLRLKQRHFLTRQNRLRLRYSVSALGGMAVVVALYAGGQINPISKDINENAGAIFANALEPSMGETAPEPLLSFLLKPSRTTDRILESAGLNSHRDQTGQIRRDRDVIESAELAEKEINTNSPAAEERHIEISRGGTLAGALIKAGLGGSESQLVVSAVGKHFDLRSLQSGQELTLTVEPGDTASGYVFSALSFTPDPLRRVDVARDDNGRIVATVDKKKVVQTHEAREVNIQGSVYGSADKANLPDRITASTIKLFSYAVDFQRDIHSGDKLNVMYDSYKTDDGYVAKTGDIVFAKMTVAGREYALYRHQARDGQVDYYTADGKSIRKSSGLMRTPVAYGRMSSGFGMRVHPVLGYTKIHKGVDFAAPTGTAVYASGNGVVERAGRFSSFGNYVRLRHSSKMSTAYAHLSRFAQGIRPGVSVKQGQLIGYVGTTGRSTGPHLHYEVLVNNVQVNPGSVKLVTDNSLKGDELQRFKGKVRSMGQEYTKAITAQQMKLASR